METAAAGEEPSLQRLACREMQQKTLQVLACKKMQQKTLQGLACREMQQKTLQVLQEMQQKTLQVLACREMQQKTTYVQRNTICKDGLAQRWNVHRESPPQQYQLFSVINKLCEDSLAGKKCNRNTCMFVHREVCEDWLAGKRCNRHPCTFMHTESPPLQNQLVLHRNQLHRNPCEVVLHRNQLLRNQCMFMHRESLQPQNKLEIGAAGKFLLGEQPLKKRTGNDLSGQSCESPPPQKKLETEAARKFDFGGQPLKNQVRKMSFELPTIDDLNVVVTAPITGGTTNYKVEVTVPEGIIVDIESPPPQNKLEIGAARKFDFGGGQPLNNQFRKMSLESPDDFKVVVTAPKTEGITNFKAEAAVPGCVIVDMDCDDDVIGRPMTKVLMVEDVASVSND